MTKLRKDLTATGLTGLAVLVYAATHEGWNVWLIGDNHRWAAAAILVLGILSCVQGEAEAMETRLLPLLGTLALVLAIVALATGSLTPLSLLVLDIVVLWALSTVRHHAPSHHTHAHA